MPLPAPVSAVCREFLRSAPAGLVPRGRLDPVWTDPDRFRAFTVADLDTHWRATAAALASRPADDPDTCAWCVLGVTRLHHRLVTGERTTRSGAGRWGLDRYPERFHRVLREALAIREGGRSEYPADAPARLRDTVDLTTHVVAAGTS